MHGKAQIVAMDGFTARAVCICGFPGFGVCYLQGGQQLFGVCLRQCAAAVQTERDLCIRLGAIVYTVFGRNGHLNGTASIQPVRHYINVIRAAGVPAEVYIRFTVFNEVSGFIGCLAVIGHGFTACHAVKLRAVGGRWLVSGPKYSRKVDDIELLNLRVDAGYIRAGVLNGKSARLLAGCAGVRYNRGFVQIIFIAVCRKGNTQRGKSNRRDALESPTPAPAACT